VSLRSPNFEQCISASLNLTSGVIWVLELGFGCYLGPNADVARSYMWGTVATISKIFQKLYLFHMISDEDDFYMKNVSLDEIYNFLVLNF
jgi:hypothetical protein